jgi:conjugal transfer ATP-binding protein TraC
MNTEVNFHESYPIVDIEQNRVLANNGNIAYAYRVELPEIYSLSEADFEELHGHWFQALKSLPIGTLVHKQDIYRKTSYDASRLPKGSFLAKATRDHFEGREHLSHESLIFFIWPKNRAINSSALINPFAKASKKLPQTLGKQAEEFGKAVRDTVGYLNNSPKLKLLPFNQAAMIQYTDAYFNGFNEGFDTDMVLEKDRVQVGEHRFGAMAVNNEACFGDTVQTSRPNEQYTADGFLFHQGFIDGFGLTFPGNHIVNQIIHLDDRHKWRRLLEKRLEELSKSSNFGSRNKLLYDRVSDTLNKLNEDDSSLIIRGQLNVLCWAKSEKDLDRCLSELTARFKELDIQPYCPVGRSRIHYVLNSYPMFSSNFADTDLYVTDLKHALCLWINSTNYRSDKKGIIFNDRLENIPVVKDVWDEGKRRIKARNFAIFAPTGEGKSFLANNILRQYFEQDVRLVIIDLGGSYDKFAQLYPGEHIILKYEPGKNLGINPFYLPKPHDVGAEWLEDLTNFLMELYATNDNKGKAHQVALKKILRSYYEKVKEGHSLEGLYTYIQEHQYTLLESLGIATGYFNLTNFLHILSEYVGDGIYSFLFKVGEDQSHRLEDKRLIIFELDEVRENREVLSVMLKLIKSAIQRTIW